MLIMSDSAGDDPTVTALLAMSEFFVSQRPQAVCEAARCLLAVLALRPVPRVEASVRLRLGLLLSEHTSCALEAKEQLEKSMLVAGTSGNMLEVRFHAASSLAGLLATQGHQQQARGLLRGKLEATSHHPYWHTRLLLQLADLMSSEGDVAGQMSMLSRCADYCQRVGAGHTHLLATLARGAVLLTHHNYSEAGSVLNVASSALENHRGPGQVLLRTFYLTIQVTHLLMAGQVKTAKPHLKQLQQCVQSLSNQPEEKAGPVMTSDLSGVGRGSADDFLWLTRHHAYITVYLVSVLHSVQAGLTDKALSYVDRALQLINQEIVSSVRPSGVLGVLKVHILEQSVQCLLMRGETTNAATQLQDLVDVCHAHPVLVYSHRAVLHTLLGLYAFATGGLDRAAAQLQTALQHTNCRELRVLISLNLAVCFMKMGTSKDAELAALMTSVTSDGAGVTCQSLQSAVSYVRGLFSFTSGRIHDAKRQLRETLAIANASDLNKLTSCSLLLLGQIFMALGNNKETLDMVTPALQLSVKMPENSLQVWAASLLADLYRTLGQPEKEQVLRQQSSGVSSQLEEGGYSTPHPIPLRYPTLYLYSTRQEKGGGQ
jgi:MAternally-affected-uncoordination protein